MSSNKSNFCNFLFMLVLILLVLSEFWSLLQLHSIGVKLKRIILCRKNPFIYVSLERHQILVVKFFLTNDIDKLFLEVLFAFIEATQNKWTTFKQIKGYYKDMIFTYASCILMGMSYSYVKF